MEVLETEPLIRASHIRETDTQDGTVLLDPIRGQCYPLDAVSTLIWKELGAGCTSLQIAEIVVATYHISLDVATADVSEFVQSLLEAGLVASQGTAVLRPPRAWWRELVAKLWPASKRAARNR